MAHLANPDRSYRLLQQRLDRNVTGAPDSPAFAQILKLLFSPEDAEIARQMPTQFVSVTRLARKLGQEPAELDARLLRMAERGLVLDRYGEPAGVGGDEHPMHMDELLEYLEACAARSKIER